MRNKRSGRLGRGDALLVVREQIPAYSKATTERGIKVNNWAVRPIAIWMFEDTIRPTTKTQTFFLYNLARSERPHQRPDQRFQHPD